ncbi:phosphotransferase [Cohnella sp. CFH 77786]|uniref:phosphotransferase n=1 Tax=Cohnella sp. CFH 77786 TaxID=2662265 RepID=UPI001C60F5CB|nr:phosphotransferase [Cohnella sp. CFH 77786]MBW5446052.1 phosphotransferase [Cohnella sp. CFH 77786]
MNLWTHVEETYGLKFQDIFKVHGVHRIETSQGRFCLKKYSFAEDSVRFIARLLYVLHERGFMRAQGVYPTLEQIGYMNHDGVFYTLTNWVDGDRPEFRKTGDFKKAIRTLARFHSAAQGFPVAEAPEGRVRYGEAAGDIEEYKRLLGHYAETAFLVPLCEEALWLLAQPDAQQAVVSEFQAAAFVHGDYNYPNLIKDGRGRLHLIDFENTSLNARMKDLAHILHRNFLWNGREMLRWIDYYERKRPLSPHDLHLLHALLTAPYHVVRNIRIGGYRYAKSVIPSSSRLRKYRRELRELL